MSVPLSRSAVTRPSAINSRSGSLTSGISSGLFRNQNQNAIAAAIPGAAKNQNGVVQVLNALDNRLNTGGAIAPPTRLQVQTLPWAVAQFRDGQPIRRHAGPTGEKTGLENAKEESCRDQK